MKKTSLPRVDVSYCPSPHGLKNKAARVLWHAVWLSLFRPSPKVLYGWRGFLLRLFGARLGKGVHVHPSCRIWAPWNLTIGDHGSLAPYVDCYNVAPITIGAHTVVSQYSHLCAASHDYEHPSMPLIMAPVTISDQVWICTDVFIGPGVIVGEGVVVGARASVFKNIDPWIVVAGTPAKFIKRRVLKDWRCNV